MPGRFAVDGGVGGGGFVRWSIGWWAVVRCSVKCSRAVLGGIVRAAGVR